MDCFVYSKAHWGGRALVCLQETIGESLDLQMWGKIIGGKEK